MHYFVHAVLYSVLPKWFSRLFLVNLFSELSFIHEIMCCQFILCSSLLTLINYVVLCLSIRVYAG